MRSYGKTLLLTVGILLAGTTLVGFGAHTMHGEDHLQWLTEKVSRELDLGTDQVARLDTVKQRLIAARERMHQDHEQRQQQILTLLAAPTLDQESVLAIVRDKTGTVNELAPEVVAALADFYASLDDAQRQTVREHVADRMQHHNQPHHW